MNFLNGNYVDLIIIAVLIYFISTAWRYGFIKLAGDSISFLFSLFISLRIYKYISVLLMGNFDLSKSVADALGFMVTAILIETILGTLIYFGIEKLPKKIKDNKFDKALGVIPALLEGFVFVAFILSLFVSFPIRPNYKKDILDSKIGSVIIKNTNYVENSINKIFGGIIGDTLNYLTVKTEGRERVDLKTSIDKLSVDSESENKMLDLINEERVKAGVSKLTWNANVVPIARDYATDMWKRSYFSHYSPEGEDVGDRLENANIKYKIAGENLALAPSLAIAHNGLMNSEGHRANILSKEFNKVGIGVIDNGVYGKMFVQIFTD